MPTYAEALRNSLRDRATDLRRYLEELRTANWSAEARFRRAMDMLEWYASAIIKQLEFDWETAADTQTKRERVQSLLDLFTEKERMVDHRLARAGQVTVPRALSRLVDDGIAALGLSDIDAVVSVGPPGNFDTQIPDLWRLLSQDISLNSAYDNQEALHTGRLLCLISLPYIEGTRALWQPIVVGHELGHLRLGTNEEIVASLSEASRLVTPDLIAEEFDRVDVERLAEIVEDTTINPIEDLRSIYRCWRAELLCDLNVVRRYGPGGIAAVGEFLSILQKSEEATASHPPLWLRLSLMLDYFRGLWGRDTDLGVAEPWADYVDALPRSLDAWSTTIERLLLDNMAGLQSRVDLWGGEPYGWPDRIGHVNYLSLLLQRGQPGDVSAPMERDPLIVAEDIVNAAWVARSEARDGIPLDRLATKAIDTLAFVRAWQAAELELEDGSSQEFDESTAGELDDEVDAGHEAVGVLSGSQLRARIRDSGLVVTPLFDDAIGAAGLDVRLSSSFIVFRHSSTVAFSALNSRQDPRTMQERVEKSWGESFVLHPGELVLASTIEYLIMPDDLCAQVVTRSSYGRLGLITATAVQVQPGSIGCITLEMVNLSQTPIELTSGERIAQLVFLPVKATSRGLRTEKYQYQTGPEFSRVYEDRDVAILRVVRGQMHLARS